LTESSVASKLGRRIFANFGLKVTSLVVAILLWLAVSNAPQTEMTFTVPIEFRNVAEGVEVTSEDISQAQVRLRGPGRVVRELRATDLRLTLDLRGFSPTTAVDRTFALRAQQVSVPSGVEVLQIVPSYLQLGFDRRATRTVEVKARVIGSLAPGYKIVSVAVDPRVLSVVGPEARLTSMETALTDPIDASGLIGPHTFVAAAHVRDPLIRFTQPTSVRVTVTTEKVK
jgi:YbbR domain-containing protein